MATGRHQRQKSAVRYQWGQKFLVSLAFAFVALATSSGVLSTTGNPNLGFAGPFAAGGAFISTLLLWPKDFGDRVRLMNGTLSGILIGLLSHPMMFVCYLPFLGITQAMEHGFTFAEIGEAFYGSIFIVLWGMFCSLIGVGWLTALIGGASGFLIAGFIKYFEIHRRYKSEKNNPPPTLTIEEHNHPDHQDELKLTKSKRRATGAVIALGLIAAICVPLAIYLAEVYRENSRPQPEVIIKQAAEPQID